MRVDIFRFLLKIKKWYFGKIYRPKGYLVFSEENSWPIELLHDCFSVEPSEDLFYNHFNGRLLDETSFEMKSVKISKFKNARVLTNLRNAVAIIDEDDRILGEYSFTYAMSADGKFHHVHVSENNFLEETILDAPLKVSGAVFSMLTGGEKNFNFYHWFFDVLSRAFDLKDSGWFGEVDYFLVPE